CQRLIATILCLLAFRSRAAAALDVMRWIYLSAAPFVALLVLACESGNDDKRPPETPHNTDHATYATEYPEAVENVTKDIDDDKNKAAEQCAKYSGYPDQIKEPTDYEKVS